MLLTRPLCCEAPRGMVGVTNGRRPVARSQQDSPRALCVGGDGSSSSKATHFWVPGLVIHPCITAELHRNHRHRGPFLASHVVHGHELGVNSIVYPLW